MSGDNNNEVVCVLCWTSTSQQDPRPDIDTIIQNFVASTKHFSPASADLGLFQTSSDSEASLCDECLSDVTAAAEKGEEVAKMEVKVRHLQRELLENLRILLTLTDNYLRRMSTLEGTIKRSPAPEQLLGRRQRMERSNQFRDGILNLVQELQRCRGELGARVDIPEKVTLSQKIKVEISPDKEDLDGDYPDNNEVDSGDEEGLTDSDLPENTPDWELESDTEKIKKGATPECSICQKVFSRWSNLETHKRDVHAPRVSCPDCQKRVAPHRLKFHQANQCRKRPTNTCGICKRSFAHSSDARRHERKHKEEERESEPEIEVEAPEKIQEGAVKKGPFKCPSCDATFKCQKYLNNHRKGVHEKLRKSYPSKTKQCQHCGKWLSSNGFSGHVKYHCSGRPKEELVTLVCEGCGLTLRGRYDINKHKRICPGLGKKGDFRCEFCGKGGFATEKYLEFHMERHQINALSTMPFLCVRCGRGFNSGTGLNRHSKKCDGKKKPRGARRDMLKPLPLPPKEDDTPPQNIPDC